MHAQNESSPLSEVLSAQDLVDFSPVYRCLHIYTALDVTVAGPSLFAQRIIAIATMLLSAWSHIWTKPDFARSGPVPGFQGDTLQLAFIDLRQLLDLFIQWDWSTYLADYGQSNCKYLRVNPMTALALLDKMKDTSRKNNVFAQFRKNERDKQKLIDTVAKQLRSLINSMSHQH
ncbi:exocyst complex component 6B-like [Rhincodon typus]|uniref:exocyst complex component 6B-like n=1 Tax=Rhincodon typus TaxID=259920 RepID=UPI00202E3515|nr:exocyst complex component 6B-like [Rhincodon typus]